ncbi:cupin domain-containing protein [Amycolatopsis rubida]|uniref:Cupin domain-containing protein n=1 Tax=Amycolatopsis rubida TaxID=112413 RepID=A0ABX0C3G9_9PSEU|nr:MULTISPECIES: cupin domain-containing protein [Amycolatopsis]MYW96116.1 cupin domain-containing protein [Amycolatopsis rubida]NEC61107.1 cupin domain-containing protein [Amycolatopsis rubida]OAP23371.1 Cupin domain protein [Amycolatopsis sp. M39]
MAGEHRQAQARRVVTGVNDEGKSCFVGDELTPHRFVGPGNTKCDLWRVAGIPVSCTDGDGIDQVRTEPPKGGLVVRQTTFAPDSDWDKSLGYSDAAGQLAGTIAPEDADGVPGFHFTESVDVVTVLNGELVAIMETGEKVLRAGDTIVMRGTNHAWENRTDEPVTVQSIMISAG